MSAYIDDLIASASKGCVQVDLNEWLDKFQGDARVHPILDPEDPLALACILAPGVFVSVYLKAFDRPRLTSFDNSRLFWDLVCD